MPTYRVKLTNGKTLVLRGDAPPTDADIEAAADQAGVRELLTPTAGEASPAAPSQSTDLSPIPPGLALGAGMAAAPAAVSLAHRAAGLAGKVAAARVPSAVPAVIALDAAADAVINRDPKRAAVKAGGAVAASQVPRVLRAVQAATAPARTVPGGASAVLQANGTAFQLPAVTTPGGVVSRLASAASRVAGPLGLAIDAVTTPGHRPVGMTPETTAARQATFAHAFKEQVNREAGYEVIKGSTVGEILDSIAAYKGLR